MKTITFLFSLVILAATTPSPLAQTVFPNSLGYGLPASPGSQNFKSPNGKFTLTLSHDGATAPAAREILIKAILSTNLADSTQPLWSTTFNSAQFHFLQGDVHVADEGDCFVL